MEKTERFDDKHFLSLGDSVAAIKPGDIIGGTYVLKALLGQGGMGYVFLAEHNIIKKDYALKIIRPDKIDDFSWQRFEVEGRAIAKLDHPNIVRIYNMGVDQGKCPFYVMDLLPGKPLSDYIRQGDGLTFEQCLDIFHQVADGLAYAHRKGIIHRDVKPANIILLQENDSFQAKVVDFGLAKMINPIAGQVITAKGQIFGSPYYMSPEQCLGQPVDHRSDIYSLGCALFESVAGEPPFVGANAVQTLMMHTEAAMPKLADRFSEQPAIAVDSLIAKMTAKEPQDRYQSMNDVSAAVGRLQKRAPSILLNIDRRDNNAGKDSDSSIVKSSVLASSDKYWLLVGALLVIVSLGAVVAFSFRDYIHGRKTESTLSPDVVALLDFGPIVSRPASATGYREFVFPGIPIGSVAELGGRRRQVAVDSVLVKSGKRMVLTVDQNEVPLVFKYPQVLEKIGKSEFCGLYLKANGIFAQGAADSGSSPTLELGGALRGERIAYSQKRLIAILKIVSSWSELNTLALDTFAVNDRVFQLLEGLPRLTALTIKRADFSMQELTGQKFLDRLNSLAIQDPSDSKVDPLLYRLSSCPNLTSLELDTVELSLKSFSTLKRCPRLKTLTLKRSDVSNAVIAAISEFKELEAFYSEGIKFTDSQLASLAQMKNLHVILEASDYAEGKDRQGLEILKSYRARFPTISFQ